MMSGNANDNGRAAFQLLVLHCPPVTAVPHAAVTARPRTKSPLP